MCINDVDLKEKKIKPLKLKKVKFNDDCPNVLFLKDFFFLNYHFSPSYKINVISIIHNFSFIL